MTPMDIAQFWSSVVGGRSNECWEWQGAKNQSGYGKFRTRQAHRIAYTLTKGAIPEGHLVRHLCDNPKCCNPSHLLTGTSKDNAQDAVDRMRVAVGQRNGRTKLRPEDVTYIRRNPEKLTGRALAERFNVARSTISYIQSGRSWKYGAG